MNWNSDKTWAVVRHLGYGAAGAAVAYLTPAVLGLDWAVAGPLAPLITLAVGAGSRALVEWLKKQEADAGDDAPGAA